MSLHQEQLVKTKQKTHTQKFFYTFGTGHMYLLRVPIGSFDWLQFAIGLVLVYDI